MIYPQLVGYIKDSLAKNIPIEQIKKSLLEKGWKEPDVNESVSAVTNQPLAPMTSPNQPLGINTQPAKNAPMKKIPPALMFGIIGGVALLFVIILVVSLFSTMTPSRLSDDEILLGSSINLGSEKEIKFNVNEEEHRIVVGSVSTNSAGITIYSTPISITLSVGQEEKFDLNSDNVYDLQVRLNSISKGKANIFIQKISEEICIEEWACDDWTPCINLTQSRTCTDANSCGSEESKPEETQECIAEVLSCAELGGAICTASQNCTGNITESSDGNCCVGSCAETALETISCADIDCLISAAGACSSVNVTHAVSSGNTTWTQSVNYYYKIRGFEGEKCELYQETIDATGNFTDSYWATFLASPSSPNTTTEGYEIINSILSNLAGKTGICRFSTTALNEYLTAVKNENHILTSDEVAQYECTGTLYA